MLQWMGLILAIVAYQDERKHREWQRAQSKEGTEL